MAEMYLSECKGSSEQGEIVPVVEALAMAASISASSESSLDSGKVKIRKADDTMPCGGFKITRRRVAVAREENSASYASCVSPESEVVVAVTAAEGENCPSTGGFSLALMCSSSSDDAASSCGEAEKDRVVKSGVDPEEVESALTTSKKLDSRSAASMERVSISDMAISTSKKENTKIGGLKWDELESPPRNLAANSTVQIKMPPDSLEIEEFFAAAEKNIHKRFSEKYNFDIVKDVPLEGRYEWVPLKP